MLEMGRSRFEASLGKTLKPYVTKTKRDRDVVLA
jgi:hypothetical protein